MLVCVPTVVRAGPGGGACGAVWRLERGGVCGLWGLAGDTLHIIQAHVTKA